MRLVYGAVMFLSCALHDCMELVLPACGLGQPPCFNICHVEQFLIPSRLPIALSQFGKIYPENWLNLVISLFRR